jgi:hypothetical protein
MNFKPYDILTHLVPGFLILFSGIYSFNNNAFNDKLIIPYTAIAFVLGYFINTLLKTVDISADLTFHIQKRFLRH